MSQVIMENASVDDFKNSLIKTSTNEVRVMCL